VCLWWAVLPWNPISGMHSVAVWCRVLQCVAVCLWWAVWPWISISGMHSVAGGVVCGRVRQCVAVCCCVCLVWAVLPWNLIFGMQSTAASCRMLQCVAVCCSVRTHDRVSHAAISLSNCVCARLTTHDQI